ASFLIGWFSREREGVTHRIRQEAWLRLDPSPTSGGDPRGLRRPTAGSRGGHSGGSSSNKMLSFRSSAAVRQRLHTLSSTLSRTARIAIDRNNQRSTKNRWLSYFDCTTMSGRGEGRATAVAASSASAAAPLRPSALGVTRGSCSHHGAPRGSVVGVAGAGAVAPGLLEISSTTADATAAGGGPRGGVWAPAGSAAVAALAAAAVVAAAAAAAAEPFKGENHRIALAAAALGIEERGTLTRLRGFESLSSSSGGGGGGGAAASGCHGSDVSGVGGGGDAGGGSG
ncbi:unnamed protein product, partial [Scytosiphon promiscuus]